MKRLGNIWPQLVSMDTMTKAVYEAIRFKRSDPMVIKKLMTDGKVDLEKVTHFAKEIVEQLNDGTYRCDKPLHKHLYCTSKSKAYGKGKWRDIYCPSLRDHVLHHALMIVCMPAFTRGMDDHCCGSIPGRGTIAVKRYVEKWTRSGDTNYFVKLDVAHFFDSIEQGLLMQCFARHIKDTKVLDMLAQVVRSAPIACPVGYYTSPWFANLFLQDLDHFIKQDLYKERRGKRIPFVVHHVRYMDDMLLMGNSKRDLEKAVRAIIKFCANIGLKIKTCWEIKRIAILDGHKVRKDTYRIDICGYVFDREHTRVRDGIYLSTMRLARKMRTIKRKHNGYMSLKDCQSLVSKAGWAEHANSVGMLHEIDRLVNFDEVRKVISNATKCGIYKQT